MVGPVAGRDKIDARWARRKSDPNLGFLLGWAIGPLLVLECFRTKLIHYYLPAIPACALLTAWLVLSVTAEGVNIEALNARPSGDGALLVGIALTIGVVDLVAGTTVAAHRCDWRWNARVHRRHHRSARW